MQFKATPPTLKCTRFQNDPFLNFVDRIAEGNLMARELKCECEYKYFIEPADVCNMFGCG